MNHLEIRKQLLDWYTTHYRPLPWRQEPTPYRVWVSEIMLQQTRIEAVMPYYRRFMDALPQVEDLAAVDPDTLMKLWEGLGYYSRARNLQKAAHEIVSEYGGQLPADYDLLLSLPGIGPYTAGAIASIAYHIPVPAVDGNVMRVLARLTGDSTDVLSTAGKRLFTDVAWQLVPENNPGRFNQALMELGETVCIPNAVPHCDGCPLAALCIGRKEGTAAQLPVRSSKKNRRIEQRTVAVVRVESEPPRVLLHRRPAKGLLAGLWELPNELSSQATDVLPASIRDDCQFVRDLSAAKHLFSHIEWQMKGQLWTAPDRLSLPPDYEAVTLEELQTAFALPSAFRHYAVLLGELLTKES